MPPTCSFEIRKSIPCRFTKIIWRHSDGNVTTYAKGITASDASGRTVITFGNEQVYKVKIKGTGYSNENLDCIYTNIVDGEIVQRVTYEDKSSQDGRSYTLTITPYEVGETECVMTGGYGGAVLEPTNHIAADFVPVEQIKLYGLPYMQPTEVIYPIQTVKIYPENATITRVSYSSSNTDVATVDNDGKIRALKYGTTTIRVSAMDGSGVYADYKLNVGAAMPFDDIKKTDWHYPAVSYVYKNGLMSGLSTRIFSPDTATTRGMIVTILYRLEGTPSAGDSTFKDVSSGQYYAKAVAWAAKNDIVAGYSKTKFGPEDAITREQMASILYRYAKYKGYDISAGEYTSIEKFPDVKYVSGWAKTSVCWAYGEGILSGMGDGTLVPQGNAGRGQVASILMRFCENIVEE